MEIIDKVLVEPTPEDEEVVVDRRLIVDEFPPFSKEEPFEVIMEYVRLQVADGKDMSWFTYDMIPDTMGEEEPKKKRNKKSSEADKTGKEKAAKKQKKTEKERNLYLKSYSEAYARGTSEFQTSGIHTPSQIETSVHIPPSTTSDSEVTHSNNSPTKSSVSSFQDPPSSSTVNMFKLKNPDFTKTATTTPPFIISTQPTPISSLSPVITPPYSNTPMSESIHVSAPLVSGISVSEPMSISSAPPTGNIPVVYLDISDDEILISDAIPTVTSPSDPLPQTELIPFKPIPNNLEECINLFGYDALIRIHELRTSACPHPVLVRRAWEDFRRWLDQLVQNIAQMAESTKQTEVLAAAER